MEWSPTQPPHPQQHVLLSLQRQNLAYPSLCFTAPDGLVILVFGAQVLLRQDTDRGAGKTL